MKPQTEKTRVATYLEHGYNYIVVFTEGEAEDHNQPLYERDFFKTRRQAECFNAEKLHGFGEVMTTRQAVKKYEFIID